MGLDRRERSGELVEGIMVAQEGHQARIWTAMPGIVQSFNAAKRTCVVQPATQALVSNPDGTEQWVSLPVLVDCPVQFPGGGDVVLTFPLKAGDECLVVFASRCIDAWWQNGCPLDSNGQFTAQPQAELRMHDLSDGFCVAGVSSVPRVEAGIDTGKATLRSRDGTAFVSLDPASHEIDVQTTGAKVTVKPNEVDADVGSSHVAVKPLEIDLTVGPTSVSLTPSGLSMATTACSISVAGGQVAVTGTLVINGNPYMTHHHTGVTPGGGNTGDVA